MILIIFDPQGDSDLYSEDQYEDENIINLNIPSLFSQPEDFSLIEDDLEIRPADLATIESMTTTKPTVRYPD